MHACASQFWDTFYLVLLETQVSNRSFVLSQSMLRCVYSVSWVIFVLQSVSVDYSSLCALSLWPPDRYWLLSDVSWRKEEETILSLWVLMRVYSGLEDDLSLLRTFLILCLHSFTNNQMDCKAQVQPETLSVGYYIHQILNTDHHVWHISSHHLLFSPQ